MKKITLLFFLLAAIGFTFQACDDTKSYAEQLEDEKNAINKFIRDNNITLKSFEDFEKDTITAENEYVFLPYGEGGVYMNIVNRGKDEKFKSGNEVLVRFIERDIMGGYETGASNVDNNTYVDSFQYLPNDSYNGNLFFPSWLQEFYYRAAATSITRVPAGWLYALPYLKDYAHVKLIVPSKSGHTYSGNNVLPYFYDIRKLQIW